MDSGLLNIFHDDQFDCNYIKYDSDSSFWSSINEPLSFQLTDTLHGILPIAPADGISSNIYSNSFLKDDEYTIGGGQDTNLDPIVFGNYEDNILSTIPTIDGLDIIPVDAKGGYDSELLESSSDEGNFGTLTNNDVYDNKERSCSRSTFRTRTESSSIGDYESHSSDYDSECIEDIPIQTFNIGDADLLKDDDVDPFAMQIDPSTFDLAAFITEDDLLDYQPSHSNTIENTNSVEVIGSNKTSETDSDSDVIIDVETVENDDKLWTLPDNIIEYDDNVKTDPSWSPKKQKQTSKKETKSTHDKAIVTKVIPAAVAKKRKNNQKRKYGVGRGKNLSMYQNPKKKENSSKSSAKLPEQKPKSPITTNVEIKPKMVVESKLKASTQPTKKPDQNQKPIVQCISPQAIKIEEKPKLELELEANIKIPPSNDAIFKANNIPTTPQPVKEDVKPQQLKNEPSNDVKIEEEEIELQQPPPIPQKRKLNIEEYKRRRNNVTALQPIIKNNQTPNVPIAPKTETICSQIPTPITLTCPPKIVANKPQQNAAVSTIVKSLKENQVIKSFVDPITEAKNKVLRMQELKKAQQIKIIDSTVSSKVGKVTKLPPLKDIVKDSTQITDTLLPELPTITNPEYETIIFVSTGCNTDMTIPPIGFNNKPKFHKNASRSLLKSSVLLANISNTFQKVRAEDCVKISSSSLIASIQDVVVKTSTPYIGDPVTSPKQDLPHEHGEDKVIMHLRKDRIRKRTLNQTIQTDLLPEFPVLPLPPCERVSEDNDTIHKRRRRPTNLRSRQQSYSSDEESYDHTSSGCQYKTSSKPLKKRRHHRDSSDSSSDSASEGYLKKGRNCRTSSGTSRDHSISSRSRSRSKSYERSQRRSRSRSGSRSRLKPQKVQQNVRLDRNVSTPAVEERRIVYVGRIEHETSKEMLRRKFLSYGPIKQVTIHYKDTGMKYGFVTYDRAEDAFRVIDSGSKDPSINMYDISFGGRRAFCRASYADLDNAGINTYESYVAPRPVAKFQKEDSFEELLFKVKAKIGATKSQNTNSEI